MAVCLSNIKAPATCYQLKLSEIFCCGTGNTETATPAAGRQRPGKLPARASERGHINHQIAIGRCAKNYKPVGQVNGDGIHPDYHKKESPFPEFQHIINQIKTCQEKKGHAGREADKGAGPEVFVNREIQTP